MVPGVKRFDRKFGAGFIASLPAAPAVYLFKDDEQQVLYVGKAKNVRKRLAGYRDASRRKAHRKMRKIVREAATVEVRVQATEEDALAVENELIRALTPPLNVEGKYTFLYPAIGARRTARHTLLCFTTDTEAWSRFEFQWFGVFRSRLRAKEAFDALVDLLALVGHQERTSSLGELPDAKGSRLAGVRQLDAQLVDALVSFLSGASPDGLRGLAAALLDKPRARREASHVQELIDVIDGFYRTDLAPLHDALRAAGRTGTFVAQDERDTLFIRTR